MFSGTLKDSITNVAALLIVVATAVQQVLAVNAGDTINWYLVLSAVVVAIVGWFTGKSGTGTPKVQ